MDSSMAHLITGERLRQAVQNETFIKGGDPYCAEGVKYDFRLSSHILKASFKRPVDAQKLSETEKKELVIEPGEMVFALTEERLALPADMIAELSPKRKMSHAGVLVIGGFCIDPLYEGPLLVGLYNFSSTPFLLVPSKKVIAATFYQLDESERNDFPRPERFEGFPEDLLQVMQKYQPTSVPTLAEAVAKLRTELEGLRTEIQSHDQWYRRFEESLERHDKQIGELITSLTAEKDTRRAGEDKLTEALHKIEGTLSWLRGAAWVVSIIISVAVVAIVIPLILPWLSKIFRLGG